VYAAADIETACEKLVLSEVVWAVVHPLYVTERFLIREEKADAVSRLEICSLSFVLASYNNIARIPKDLLDNLALIRCDSHSAGGNIITEQGFLECGGRN